MIEINLDPTLIQLGPVAISWHGFFTAVGLFLGVWITAKLAPTVGISEDDIYGGAPWAVVGGILGARLFHVVDQWSYYSQRLEQIIMLQEGGIAIYGGVIGGILAGYLYGLKNKIPIAKFADAAAIGLILGQGLGRIGDIINGEHHGKPLDAPWAVVYTHPRTLGEPGLPVHLAVGYEMALDLLVFLGLIYLWKRLPAGVIFWLYLVAYSVIRLFVGFYRIDSEFAFGLGQAQLIGVVGIIVGIPLALWSYRRNVPMDSGESEDTSSAASDTDSARSDEPVISEPAAMSPEPTLEPVASYSDGGSADSGSSSSDGGSGSSSD